MFKKAEAHQKYPDNLTISDILSISASNRSFELERQICILPWYVPKKILFSINNNLRIVKCFRRSDDRIRVILSLFLYRFLKRCDMKKWL